MTRQRLLESVVVFVALLLTLAFAANAGEPPSVTDCGAMPYLVTYGDHVTFWADVSDPEGYEDVVSVWLVYRLMPLWPFAETDMAGHWQMEWTVPDLPEVLRPGDYELSAVAIDSEGHTSEFAPIVLSVTDHDPRVPVLLRPQDGALVWRGMPILFEWSIVPLATGYNFEIMFPDDTSVSVELPFFFTSLIVEPQLAAELPDGEYFWRVQAVFEGELGDWSESFSFEKNYDHGPPVQVEGYVISVDVMAGMMEIESGILDNGSGEPNRWGWWTVVVTDETLLTKDDEEVTLDHVWIGDYAVVDGWLEHEPRDEWRSGIVRAERIEVTSPPDFFYGLVDEILPEERAFWLLEEADVYDPNGSFHRVLIRLTEDARITRIGRPIEFEDMQLGDWAFVEGHWQDSEEGEYFLAYGVDVSNGGQETISYEGSIERINYDESYLVMLVPDPWAPDGTLQPYEVNVWITRSTEITKDDRPAGFHDLVVGDWAYVEGIDLTYAGTYHSDIEAVTIQAYSALYEER